MFFLQFVQPLSDVGSRLSRLHRTIAGTQLLKMHDSLYHHRGTLLSWFLFAGRAASVLPPSIQLGDPELQCHLSDGAVHAALLFDRGRGRIRYKKTASLHASESTADGDGKRWLCLAHQASPCGSPGPAGQRSIRTVEGTLWPKRHDSRFAVKPA